MLTFLHYRLRVPENPITRATSADEHQFLSAMAEGHGPDRHAAKRAKFILALLETGDVRSARARAKMDNQGAKRWIDEYNADGWKALLSVQPPRGGDFLARYDNGYWAERLATTACDTDALHRAVAYGTSRSEPFTDAAAFRQYVLSEFALQAWSATGRWKRPDLLSLTRKSLVTEGGNDLWSPDLQHLDNERCREYVERATAAIEVETSLWDVRKATAAGVPLNFTVKDEDLESLKRWVNASQKPLYIVQVFFDRVYVLRFADLLQLIADGEAVAEIDETTRKATFRARIDNGIHLGNIATPDVEGRIFVAPNGRVTVYGRLSGSEIVPIDTATIAKLMQGTL